MVVGNKLTNYTERKIKMKATNLQTDIIHHIVNNKNNLIVSATAGSGKTSTLGMAVKTLKQINPQSQILAIAFNTAIRNEFASKFGTLCYVHTAHQLGLSIVKAAGKVY